MPLSWLQKPRSEVTDKGIYCFTQQSNLQMGIEKLKKTGIFMTALEKKAREKQIEEGRLSSRGYRSYTNRGQTMLS